MARQFKINSMDTGLLNQISLKSNLARENPNYPLILRNSIDSLVNNLSNVYSWYISSDEEHKKAISTELGTDDPTKLRFLSRQISYRVSSAWNYLRDCVKYRRKSTVEVLSTPLLSTLANILEPRNKSYRSNDLRADIFSDSYKSPSGFQVESFTEELLQIAKTGNAHPVNLASYIHLHLVGIQPFEYANKRLARLVQNSIMYDSSVPAISTSPRERDMYNNLLEKALVGLQDRNISDQQPFYDYFSKKANNSLDIALGQLRIPLSSAYSPPPYRKIRNL